MRKRYLDDDHDADQLRQLVAEGKLPASAIVTGEQLLMKPGQTLAEKARELGVTTQTLRHWHLEHKGSGYDPDYAIRRAGHDNWLKNKWRSKDWPALIHAETARRHARHIGDVLFAVGLTAANAQIWSQRHQNFEAALWKSGVPYPKQHWRDVVRWLTHGTIERYRALKSEYAASGMDAVTAAHRRELIGLRPKR